MMKRLFSFILLLFVPALLVADDHLAASASTAHVQAAVDAADHGDTVSIPDGSATWTSGITTTKRIIIKAQNYTPTSGGASSRSVVITNNSDTGLFSFTSGNDYHCGLAGIQILNGTGGGSMIETNGTGTKVPLVYDVTLEISGLFSPDEQQIVWLAQGGVLWNMYMDGPGGTVTGNGFVIRSPRAWTTASTMGTADTDGTVNVYLEDSTILGAAAIPDIEDGGRFVLRYSTMDGSWGTAHGFTSLTGGRHWEYYNNTMSNTVSGRDISARYFWSRAGTGIFTDNVVNNAANPGEYGAPVLIFIGDTTNPTGYPQARQPGWGHDGASSVIDPIYIWNNTGARASTYGIDADWATNVQIDREIYVDDGAKPGYTKYTYPHPLRTDLGASGPVPVTATIDATGATLTVAFDMGINIGTGGVGGWSMSMSGGAVTPTYSSYNDEAGTVTLSLSRTINSGETGTVTYTNPGDGVEDLAIATDADSFSGFTVTNNSTQTVTVTPARSLRSPASLGAGSF